MRVPPRYQVCVIIDDARIRKAGTWGQGGRQSSAVIGSRRASGFEASYRVNVNCREEWKGYRVTEWGSYQKGREQWWYRIDVAQHAPQYSDVASDLL